MYYQKFITFLKEHNLYEEQMYKYWYDNSIRFDYLEEEARDFISTYYKFNKGKLVKIWSIVPFVDNDITTLINIHEYVHFYLIYDRLGKKCKINKDCEVLPIFFEKIYVNENESPELLNYYDYLNEVIEKNVDDKYKLALELMDDLVNYYNNQSINDLNSKVKRLVFKYDIKKTFNI